MIKKNELLGSEYFFSGKVKKNVMYGNLDFVIEECENADPEEIIRELKK